MKNYFARFWLQLRFWAFHCSLTALPSFLIVVINPGLGTNTTTILAMLTGITIFILIYTLAGSSISALHDQKHLFARATRLALKIRLFISVASLPLVFFVSQMEKLLFIIPDYWAGVTAGFALSSLSPTHAWSIESFPFTVGWTLLEGFILSFLLFMGTFFCLLWVNHKEKKKIFQKKNS